MINNKINKIMHYRDIEKVLNEIESDIKKINEYDDVEQFIDSKFQMFLRGGEYDDNSIDLSYHYNMLKCIENDSEFKQKLKFVLNKYIHSKTFSI